MLTEDDERRISEFVAARKHERRVRAETIAARKASGRVRDVRVRITAEELAAARRDVRY